MFHELRTYHCQPGKLRAERDRMEAAALKFFPRHGIRSLGYWTVLVGESDHDIHYILEWESMSERDAKWKAFASDPEWMSLFAESERNGPLLTSITNVFLKPLVFGEGRKK